MANMPFSLGPTAHTYGLGRLVLAAAYWMRPRRVRYLPHLVAGIVKDRLVPPAPVPDASSIRDIPPGFAGLVTDLSTPTLLAAMARGFYPQAHWGTMKWWSPPERAIMRLTHVHIARRFRRALRTTDMRIAFDTDFAAIVDRCAAPRDDRRIHLTWITPQAKALYNRLHAEGHAHSVEVHDGQGALVGGVFGVAVGPVFAALSMFHTADNASKFAIVSLYHHLDAMGFIAVDHQIMSPWVEALGGAVLPREDYIDLLGGPATPARQPGPWQARFPLAETAAWHPEAFPD